MRLPTLLVIFLFIAMPALGTTTVPRGTDLVFVIDQSGSMMGAGAAGSTANDPSGKRIEAIKALGEHLLSSARNGYVNRLSVIEFGGRNARYQKSRVQITVSRKEIPAVPRGQDASGAFTKIQAAFEPIKPVFRGDTDIGKALALAQREVEWFRDNPPALGPGAEMGQRERIVVMVTDGMPSAKGANGVQRSEIETWTRRIKQDATFSKFFVFGFNDASNYWENAWGDIWRRAATPDQDGEGGAYLIRSDEDAVDVIADYLKEIIAPGIATTPGITDFYTAPAYLKGLNFYIDYQQPYLPDNRINVLDPDGNRLPTTDRAKLSAAIRLPYPAPGKYQLRTGGAPYNVQPLPIFAQARLVAPVRSVKQYDDVQLGYELEGRGANGLFVPQANLPQVVFKAKMTDPNGVVRPVPMQYAGRPGAVVSQNPLRFDVAGDYSIKLTGTTKANNQSEHVVYQSEDMIRVDNATPIQAYFAAPSFEDPIRLWQGATNVPIDLRFRHGHTGTELPVADVLQAGAGLRVGWYAVGSDSDAEIPMTDLAAGNPGLDASMTLDFGRTRWDLLWGNTAGVRLLIEPTTADPWRAGMNYAGIAETGDLWVGPELQVTESPWVLLIWAAVLLVLLLLAALLWWFYGERWLIERSDKRFKREPRLVFSVPRSPAASQKVWPLKGARIVTDPRLVTLADGDIWSMEKFRIRRLRRPGNKVAVVVRYRPHGAKKGVATRRLEATNDSATQRARHSIQGLPEGQSADFVLFVGKS
ncbi:MAG: VWA domain-containing protein [Thiohalocapsa sp. PB-PSB1]|jgi:hypothetical protein|nr:MAG: VWA domain-containing protein [Thiohalocapsa sp. PB-PSB1]